MGMEFIGEINKMMHYTCDFCGKNMEKNQNVVGKTLSFRNEEQIGIIIEVNGKQDICEQCLFRKISEEKFKVTP